MGHAKSQVKSRTVRSQESSPPAPGAAVTGRPRGRAPRAGSASAWSLALGMLGSVLLLWGCSLDGILKSGELPLDVTDPGITETPAGARAAYNGTLRKFQRVFDNSDQSYVTVTALLSDELSYARTTTDLLQGAADLRYLSESPSAPFDLIFPGLNGARNLARQANGLLADHLADDPALRAHMYAIEGYSEVLLAELYCSGIPLTTVDYGGNYTFRSGMPTEQVFRHAAALFDTALALMPAGDSLRILNLSRVGRARALLGAGEYAAAAGAAAEVSDTFRYQVIYSATDLGSDQGMGVVPIGSNPVFWDLAGVSDHEGTNGLDYRSSGDPRTPVTLLGSGQYHPDKYPTSGADTVALASGVEARLIAAEAALRGGDPAWLVTLNALRTDGTYDLTATSPPDTLWHAGTGGVAGLGPLDDPGADAARVDLLFRERAFWLFLTGHRQGDMRRLVQQYGRPQESVYPIGATLTVPYGTNIDVPIPWSERTLNPLFAGCSSRN